MHEDYDIDKYQGREFEITLQGPTQQSVDDMISYADKFRKRFKMGEMRVLERGKDPDGGYKAIVTAHNFNLFKFIKRTKERRQAKKMSPYFQRHLERAYRREDIAEKRVKESKKKAQREEKEAREAERRAKKEAKEAREAEALRKKAEREETKTRIAVAKAQRKAARQGRLTNSGRISKRKRLPA